MAAETAGYLVKGIAEEWLREAKRGASTKAELPAGDLRRVGGEVGRTADVAPEAMHEHLQPAVLVARPGGSLLQPGAALELCMRLRAPGDSYC